MNHPTAIICLTGSELTRGETHDTNGPFLSTELTSMGFRVEELRLIPDDLEHLEHHFRECAERAHLVLISGGLGPTADDCTILALARVFDRAVERDPEATSRMRKRALARWHSEEEIPDNFYKQAEVVAGSRVLLNPAGLAPGCVVETERGLIITLPGVPRELTAMFHERVVPEISSRFDLTPGRIVRGKLLGVPESSGEARIQALGIDFQRVEYGISARPGELTIKFLAHDRENHAYVDEVVALLRNEFADELVLLPEGLSSSDDDGKGFELARVVHELLLPSGLTVATAESCTGGLLGKVLTDHPGSSGYFLGSIVAYHNAVKNRLLGIDRGLLEEHGAVSREVCRAMALNVKTLLGADYGLAVTGIAGPSGGTEEKPVGLVYTGLASPDESDQDGGRRVEVVEHKFPFPRDMVRTLTTVHALDQLRRDLERRGGYHQGR